MKKLAIRVFEGDISTWKTCGICGCDLPQEEFFKPRDVRKGAYITIAQTIISIACPTCEKKHKPVVAKKPKSSRR